MIPLLVCKCISCCLVGCSLAGESGDMTIQIGMLVVRPQQHRTGTAVVSAQSAAATWRKSCGSRGSRHRSPMRRRSMGWSVNRITGRGCVVIRRQDPRLKDKYQWLAGDCIIPTITRNLSVPSHFLHFTPMKNISDVVAVLRADQIFKANPRDVVITYLIQICIHYTKL